MNHGLSRWLGLFLLSTFTVAVVVGCGGSKPSNRPKTIPVQGVVKYKGAPVEGASITLISQDPKGKGAVGRTDKSGKYQLTTFEPGDGVLPGSYLVKISKTTTKSQLTEQQEQEYMAKGKTLPPMVEKDELPAKYKQEKTSGLTAEVKEGAKPIDFELTD